MCLYDKQYDVVLLYVYMMRPSSIKKIVIADDNFFLLGGEVWYICVTPWEYLVMH